MKIAVPDLVTNSYFPALAAEEKERILWRNLETLLGL